MTQHDGAGQGERAPRYRFRLSRDMTLAAALRDYPDLVFAGLRRQALMQPLNEPLLAVVALQDDAIVGMALAELRPDGRSAELRSLVVQPEHRGRGVATALVAHAEQALKAAGCALIDWVYRLSWAGAPVVERLLARREWLPPQTRMYHFRSDIAHFYAMPWPPAPRLPNDMAVVPWADIPEAALAAIQTRQRAAPWFPPMLSPFQLPERVEPNVSTALLHRGAVVGWMIVHHILPDTLQYTALFVAPEHQQHGGATHLVRAASLRQIESGIPNCIYQVPADNTLMLQNVQKHLAAYQTAQTESRASRKWLVAR